MRTLPPSPICLGGGSIGSTAGIRPRPGLTWYNGSKGAAITLTKSMAAELAAKNIRVNALAPGKGDTAIRAALNEDKSRMLRAEDHVGAAIFLVSDEARYITGQVLVVDGGATIRGPERAS